jgi:RNA-binding protein YlmH
MKQEAAAFQKRIRDLADRSCRENRYVFTDFLTLEEQSEVLNMKQELAYVDFTLYGGTEACERKMLRFGSEAQLGYSVEFPICCLRIEPRMKKFADPLTHRDFLGALMHLGIRRDVLGDIFVREKCAWLFCEEQMSGFIRDNLIKVRHTYVQCRETAEIPEEAAPVLQPQELIVASTRADVLVAKICRLSRSQSVELFREKKIFINGYLYENNSGMLKPGDVISIRGFGKLIYDGEKAVTRKGSHRIAVRRYI